MRDLGKLVEGIKKSDQHQVLTQYELIGSYKYSQDAPKILESCICNESFR
jgi:hypothetical protein